MDLSEYNKDQLPNDSNLEGFSQDEIKYVVLMLNQGKSEEFIVDKLVEKGHPHNKCYAIVDYISLTNNAKAEKQGSENAVKNIIVGAVILLIGIVVTAGSSGSVIAYGAILVGAIRLITGFVGLGK